MYQFCSQKSVKFWLSQSVHRNIEKVSLFYIVVLKSYHTAIQYLDNTSLSLEVTPKHDKKLTVPISGFLWSCEPNNQLHVCTTSVTEG